MIFVCNMQILIENSYHFALFDIMALFLAWPQFLSTQALKIALLSSPFSNFAKGARLFLQALYQLVQASVKVRSSFLVEVLLGEAWELVEDVELVVEGFAVGLLPGVEVEFFVVEVLVAGAGVELLADGVGAGAGVGAGTGVVLLAVEGEVVLVVEAGAGVVLFVLVVPLVVVVVVELVVVLGVVELEVAVGVAYCSWMVSLSDRVIETSNNSTIPLPTFISFQLLQTLDRIFQNQPLQSQYYQLVSYWASFYF